MPPPRRRRRLAAVPDAPELAVLIERMTDNYLQCRDWGHSWRPYTASWDTAERCYISRLRCSRCRTQRVRYIGQAGQLLGSHYDYAAGYLVQGLGRLTGEDRAVLRLASVQRVLVEDTAEEHA